MNAKRRAAQIVADCKRHRVARISTSRIDQSWSTFIDQTGLKYI